MKKFSDFAEIQALEGEKLRLDDVLNKPVIITAQRITASKYSKNESGKYLTLQFHFPKDDEIKILFTGSDVLISQIEDYKEEIPFEATIKKINRYYTLT
jgi:hypothetical protein